MIESLHIEDLGVIERADLALSPGLTALTGETGAGKTMVLTSLGLLLGQRAESTVVRAGAARTLVEGAFSLDPDSRASARAVEAGAELDEDLLIVTRTVPASGRSRAHMGGRSVPSSVLAEVGAQLVSVHGQADQLRLRSAAAQRRALDSLGGPQHAALCRRYAQAYRAERQAAAAVASWRASAQARDEEVTALRSRLAILEDLDPRPGEDTALAAEAERLDHAEELRRAAATARTALTADEELAGPDTPDVVGLLAAADRALAHGRDIDPLLSDLSTRLHELSIVAADVAEELTSYLAALDADPARLAWVQERRAQLARACRDIGTPGEAIDDVDALLAWGQRASARLSELDGPTDTTTLLSQAHQTARAELTAMAAELSAARQVLAGDMQAAVTAELEGLEMKGARLVVDLAPLEAPGPTGAETVSLLLMAHPGAPALPLGKGASGGELSRIMLAVEVVLAEAAAEADSASHHRAGSRQDRPRTFIFDEIDAGVGGRAAREIGRRLSRLARSYQVVVVTHLAQVAAWADTQLVVRKESPQVDLFGAHEGSEVRTRTVVEAVTGPDRVRELARMLSGQEDSQTARRHAAELLAQAGVAESPA